MSKKKYQVLIGNNLLFRSGFFVVILFENLFMSTECVCV